MPLCVSRQEVICKQANWSGGDSSRRRVGVLREHGRWTRMAGRAFGDEGVVAEKHQGDDQHDGHPQHQSQFCIVRHATPQLKSALFRKVCPMPSLPIWQNPISLGKSSIFAALRSGAEAYCVRPLLSRDVAGVALPRFLILSIFSANPAALKLA
jgi:hypothetical protein